MIVGKTGAGKTAAWRTLQRAMATLKKAHGSADPRYQRVHTHIINPLALSNDEIYGSFDAATHEWQDGILARIMRTVCKESQDDSPTKDDQKWVMFDGPVDTLWIESMNTLLDDNKLLTLLSGERISMPHQVWVLRVLVQLACVHLHCSCLHAYSHLNCALLTDLVGAGRFVLARARLCCCTACVHFCFMHAEGERCIRFMTDELAAGLHPL